MISSEQSILTAKCSAVVVKIASRCNFNCTYCYMYNQGDQSWKLQPKYMSEEVVMAFAERIREHCLKHGLRFFNVIIHGGEPLLAGVDRLENFINVIKDKLEPEIVVYFGLQTNGVLLNEEWFKLFDKYDVRVGISIDGPKEINDKRRVYRSGKGTYEDIVAGYNRALESKILRLKPGLLSVIDVKADPVVTYNHFKTIGATSIDFLLPDSNFSNLPPHWNESLSTTPYADWLIKIFDQWILEENSKRIKVRIFEMYMEQILGLAFGLKTLSNRPNEVLVVETDGDIEATDTLKICGDGFTKAGMNVRSKTFDDAMDTSLTKMYLYASMNLSPICSACKIKTICCGGSIQTRFSKSNGFNNPSVYCHDLFKLINHIENAVVNYLPKELFN